MLIVGFSFAKERYDQFAVQEAAKSIQYHTTNFRVKRFFVAKSFRFQLIILDVHQFTKR